MENTNKIDPFDLGSDPSGEDFDPFAEDDNVTETVPETKKETPPPATKADEPAEAEKKPEAKAESEAVGFADKPPVFEYAGATENIDDTSKTFDELRIEKSADFPELEDGKRVSWTVEYGKITKTVADPKGTSIGKMKSDIETSTEFETSLKKRGADKNPTCKVKPRVTAQSKGERSYKGVFPNLDEARASGKLIAIVPARDGKVYEIRNTGMGRFITESKGNEMLSEVKAGFVPALPPIPFKYLSEIISLFRKTESEALINIYWDKKNKRYILDVPEQTATPVSVDSKPNPEYDNEHYIHYMDIHSHCKMKAYFSETDNRDEKATRLYAVIGRLDKFFPDISVRISNGGSHLDIDPGEVFEGIAL